MPRKREPPKTPLQKYRQLKRSGFNVNVPRPDTPQAKAMVSRYHRKLFGGHITSGKNKGKYTFAITKSYSPTKDKRAYKLISKQKGVPRMGVALLPKGTKLGRVSKDYVTIRDKRRTEKDYVFDKRRLAKDPESEIKRVLNRQREKRFRIRVGNKVLPGEYHSIDSLLIGYKSLTKQYKERIEQVEDLVHIVSVKGNNQGNHKQYREAYAKARRNRL